MRIGSPSCFGSNTQGRRSVLQSSAFAPAIVRYRQDNQSGLWLRGTPWPACFGIYISLAAAFSFALIDR